MKWISIQAIRFRTVSKTKTPVRLLSLSNGNINMRSIATIRSDSRIMFRMIHSEILVHVS